ncbi:MAG: protein kinase domain-containing protein [Euzebya sp.]
MRTTSVGPGDVVADRRLIELLGTGGEGEVWEARRADGSHCALKLVRPEVLPDPEEVRRRGRWLVRIDHPSLVRVSRGGRFTTGPLAGWGFVEMDLVAGPSLQGVGPVPDALSRLEGIAEALDLLHAGAWSDGVPLIHRDVKPGNLIAAGGGLVLVDPSTMRGLDTSDLTRVGTPAYLAPEVMTGRFGPLVDVYSLAATAAALITGARGQAVFPVLERPWDHVLPEGVCAALQTDPSRRPGTCAAVIAGRPTIVSAPTDHDELGPYEPGTLPSVTTGPAWALPVLAAVTLIPALTWAVGQSRPSLLGSDAVLGAAVAALVLHLAVHLMTGRAAVGLLAPPWAWGDLLAGRGTWPDKRTSWLADVSAGTVVLAIAAVAGCVVGGLPSAAVPGVVAAAVLLLVVWQRLSRVHRRMAWAPVWTLTLPVRLLGSLPRLVFSGSR